MITDRSVAHPAAPPSRHFIFMTVYPSAAGRKESGPDLCCDSVPLPRWATIKALATPTHPKGYSCATGPL